jgi:hypothetical protein
MDLLEEINALESKGIKKARYLSLEEPYVICPICSEFTYVEKDSILVKDDVLYVQCEHCMNDIEIIMEEI